MVDEVRLTAFAALAFNRCRVQGNNFTGNAKG